MPRYCFVLMPFGEQKGVQFDAIYKGAIAPAVEELDLKCLRADEIPGPGQRLQLVDKVHRAIREATVLIADVTGSNPNVLYEVGYARALGKNVIPITQDSPAEVVSDLRQLEVLTYSSDLRGLDELKRDLEENLRSLLGETGYLRDMLEPPDARDSYILASPLRGKGGRSSTLPEIRTYGDYLGVVGIIRAFGMMFGERREPELLSALSASEDIVRSNNAYIIGSFKSNKFQKEYLTQIQEGESQNWKLLSRPGDRRKDYEVILRGIRDGQTWTWRKKTDPLYRPPKSSSEAAPVDYGLLIRGPHPHAPGKVVMILAGPHSLGTGAACLAATDSTLISKIADKFAELPRPYHLSDKDRAFWVLVKGAPSADRHLRPDQVTIEEVGVYS